MQYFTFTMREDSTNGDEWSVKSPVITNTLSFDGDVSLDELYIYFQQFVQGCGYHLPSGCQIGLINND